MCVRTCTQWHVCRSQRTTFSLSFLSVVPRDGCYVPSLGSKYLYLFGHLIGFFFHYFWLWQNIHSIKNTTLTILKLTGIKQLLSWDNHHTVNLWNYFCLILVKKLCPLNTNLPNPWVHHSICLYESCCSISYKCNHIVFFSLHTMLSRFTRVLGLFQNFLLLLKLTSCYTGIPYLYFSLLVDERLG